MFTEYSPPCTLCLNGQWGTCRSFYTGVGHFWMWDWQAKVQGHKAKHIVFCMESFLNIFILSLTKIRHPRKIFFQVKYLHEINIPETDSPSRAPFLRTFGYVTLKKIHKIILQIKPYIQTAAPCHIAHIYSTTKEYNIVFPT